ncbi:uncharacterized protein TA10080 [Theileria annulata]|uniref:GYF domain-containing protein n=1 Tax=Theileria annulata TaxID=5874 RepID=Q4U8S6_THEAN|nr:uncharacterized protein TA10080 [Theileria annulata]CAI76777.1 hypothetical protein, conserved [Theileria annulata]|eukprot:XP_953402.1 hypothetical protein, conserved [Theileria annulata]
MWDKSYMSCVITSLSSVSLLYVYRNRLIRIPVLSFIDDIRSKRRRLRNESCVDDVDREPFEETKEDTSPKKQDNDPGNEESVSSKKAKHLTKIDDDFKDVSTLDKEFVEELAKETEEEKKVEDPWLESLKTSEFDDTQVVYESPKRVVKPSKRSETVDLIYDLPKVEVIRLLISMLEDEQTPSDYLKSKEFKEKSEKDLKKSPFEVSDLAHVLTMTWQNVYFMTKEEIIESLINYKNNGKELKNYEFRWVKDELAVHGPYPHEDILMWIIYGCVSDENPILVRELDEHGNPKTEEWTKYKDSDVYNIFPVESQTKSQSSKKPEKEEEEGEDDDDEDDEPEDDGFSGKSKKKLIGVRVKDKEEEYQESDDDDYE